MSSQYKQIHKMKMKTNRYRNLYSQKYFLKTCVQSMCNVIMACLKCHFRHIHHQDDTNLHLSIDFPFNTETLKHTQDIYFSYCWLISLFNIYFHLTSLKFKYCKTHININFGIKLSLPSAYFMIYEEYQNFSFNFLFGKC